MKIAESRAWNGFTNARRHDACRNDVLVRARRQLARDCPCAYYFKDLHLDFNRGVLAVSGSVPTSALKWMLESLLSHVDGVKEVDNRVSVVSSTGLSSILPE